MSNHIIEAGWHNWNRPETEKTTYFAEYQCTGAGFKPKNRAAWTHQLTKKEAENYTKETIFSGQLNADYLAFWKK